MKANEQAIHDQVITAARAEFETTLTSRVKIGRAIISLQALRGDVVEHDKRPTYAPARQLVGNWLEKAGYGMSDTVLQQCCYVALRLADSQVAILSKGKMSFCQVYAMLMVYKDKQSSLRKFLSAVKSGRKQDYSRFQKLRQHQDIERFARNSDRPEAADAVRGLVRIDVMGDETEETYQNYLESLLSAGFRIGHPVGLLVKAAMERVAKMREVAA